MREVRIGSVFTDYDGTLAPMEVPATSSRVRLQLQKVLVAISAASSLAVITSKSFDFIFPRIRYADAWACVSGLDIRLSDGREFTVSGCAATEAALGVAREAFGRAVTYEEKRSSSKELLAFSVDWRRSSAPPKLQSVLRSFSRAGVYVLYEPTNPFVDVFCGPPDKGLAMTRIMNHWKSKRKTIFLGDSPADNGAFRVADVAVGIVHGQPTGALECDYLLDFSDLTAFLGTLLERDMVFSPDLPGLLRGRELA
ncbi:MAG: hypothetical protein OK441_04040 [Thaumarchaeota archaeon]|nr:hypothetical protein [Nitrososphaerota archaeon]